MSAEIEQRLAAVRERISGAAQRAGRDAQEITLVGVSKRQPAARVVEAVGAGLGHVGENYVQEALAKQEEVRAALEVMDGKPPTWHFIGHLQRNKARAAAEAFDWIQSLDRVSLGRELEQRAAAAGRRLRLLVQVNVSGEPQKAGIEPRALDELLASSREWSHLELAGLMVIPAVGELESTRACFAKLRELRDRHRSLPGGEALHELSMGMSGDFEVAIEEGATIVRVGTAIFGARPD